MTVCHIDNLSFNALLHYTHTHTHTGKDPASVSDEQVHTWYRDAAKCALVSSV